MTVCLFLNFSRLGQWLVALICLMALGCSSGGSPGDPAPGGEKPDPIEEPAALLDCLSCHGPATVNGQQVSGIEHAHPSLNLQCTDCHGGNNAAVDKLDAHISPPNGLANAKALKALTEVELNQVDPAYVQWVNPSDYRVVENTCGQSACHSDIAKKAPTSIMTTFAGHFNKSRYYAGSQNTRTALFGVRAIEAEINSGAVSAVSSLEAFTSPPLNAQSSLGDFQDHYLEKSCPKCHVGNYGATDIPGDYRSSGCAGCHMLYANDGLSLSGDPTVDKDSPAHPVEHVLTTQISDEQCEHCHYRGNRIGTMFRGLRERGRIDESPYVGTLNQSLHGHSPGFYIDDEDTRNTVDETPPDVHFSRGLGCVDCHMGSDVHGDGALYGAHDAQVGIECVDCHGTPESAAEPAADGAFYNSNGGEITNLSNSDFGPLLTGRLDGRLHAPPQLARAAEFNTTEDFVATHGRNGEGFSHLDSMECFACHSSWTQSCFGCHVTVDARGVGKSLITGDFSAGQFSSARSWVVTDYLALGLAMDGKITPMAPQEKMFFTGVVPCDKNTESCDVDPDTDQPGKTVFDHAARQTADGKLGFGFGPVVPHTVSRDSQPCDRCHLREDESNWDILNETLGRGSQRFQIPDGAGTLYDLTRVVDAEGNSEVGLAHEGSDVLPATVVARMLTPRVKNSGLSLKQPGEWVPVGEEAPPPPPSTIGVFPPEIPPSECAALAAETPELIVGMGSAVYEPLSGGDEYLAYQRAQGSGLLSFVSLRMSGLLPGSSDNFSDPTNPHFTLQLIAEDGSLLNEGRERARGFRARSDGTYEMVGEVIDVLLSATIDIGRRDVRLVVNLTDACGRETQKELSLILVSGD